MLKKIYILLILILLINFGLSCNELNSNNLTKFEFNNYSNNIFNLTYMSDLDENEQENQANKINNYKLYNILLYTGIGFGALGLVIFSSGMIYSIFVNTKNPDFTNPYEVGAFALMYSLIGTGLFLGLLCLPFFIASYVIFKRYKKEHDGNISYKIDMNCDQNFSINNINLSLNIKL